ncbi:MAG TPA: hypothetical protein VFG34_08885 [Sphingopyxis sp.]|nr:hypothetical protein [Sphingopyxis sp.]
MSRAPMMKANIARKAGKTKSLWALGISGAALATALILPAVAQESLLPEGFGSPEPAPKSAPTPKATPKQTPPAKQAPAPKQGSAPAPKATGSGSAGSGATAASPSNPPSGSATETGTARAAGAEAGPAEDNEIAESEYAIPGRLKYDLPPGTRRSLSRIGPLTVENGGFSSNAFGTRGEYTALLMRAASGDFASRWAHILLRRALVSALDTPSTVNGADLAAERAALLLRMGESVAARWIVQSVDYDRATKAMVSAAQQTYLATADPAGLCAYVPAGLAHGNEHVWRLSSAICSSFSGEAGPAGWAVSKVRSGGKVANFDILLTERVLGVTSSASRSTTIEWNGVDRLTDWRFAMATATGTAIPDALMASASGAMQSWSVLAPMTEMDRRLASAPEAAVRGVLSNAAYVSLLSAAAGEQEPSEGLAAHMALVRDALGAGSGDARYAGMKRLWGGSANARQQYAAIILTARAAAALPLGAQVDDDPWQLVGSMLAGGYDRNASAWISQLNIGSRAWAIMAVGSDRPLSNINASAVNGFSSDDDSTDGQRAKLLLAGLAGLDRISAEDSASAAGKLGVDFAKQSRWTRAMSEAVERQEPGMVALLAAIGMQGDWAKVPAYHLYHITRALKAVGLEAEARMIAAEALVRV